MKKIILSLIVGVQLLVSQNAFADHYRGNGRSHHYHRGFAGPRVYGSHYYGPRVVEHVYAPRVIYRPIYYRPYRTWISACQYGDYGPCYDPYLENRIYWNVDVGSGGWRIGFSTDW